ncbi:MAG: SMR family transporter [Brachybacterium paraconglomeratum]|nr:SMR family transporter [Brachybacterium paraconglomeratum]
MTAWLLLAAAILSEVTATLSLRGALDNPALHVLVVAGYVLAFTLLGQVLRRGMSLGVAYGIWGASGVVLAAAGSAILFGEVLTVLKIVGFVLVAAGVVVVEIGSQRAHQASADAATPVTATGAEAVPATGEGSR